MSHTRAQLRRTGRIGLIVSALGLAIAIAVANPALATGAATSAQPISKADANLGGANGQCPGGPYCSTRDGSPSMNGNGKGAAVGKPCAGCVGKADNKNPPGQMPNGSDHNKGYECDGNHGIGRSNPAHTGCTPPVVNLPAVNPPAVNPPVSGQPQILRELVAPEAASQFTHPLAVSAAAGEADTSGQLVAAGFAAFAAFLALGSGVALRRRHGDA